MDHARSLRRIFTEPIGGRRRYGRPVLIAGCVAALLLLAALSIVGDILYASVERDDGPADAAVVLGAAVEGAAPSPVFEERIRHAVELYKAGKVRLLVTTGGLGAGDAVAEGEAARAWAEGQGVPAASILVESASTTTQGNLANALPLLAAAGAKRVLIVSDPLHMRRGVGIARRLGIDAYSSPTPTSRYQSWASWTGFLMREWYFTARCMIVERSC